MIEHSEAPHKPRPRPPPRPPAVISVQCDLCGNTLDSPDAAKRHMRTVHNVLTYEGRLQNRLDLEVNSVIPGPFFKCDFCGLNVTDRVAHMKVAHYSPLAQVLNRITVLLQGENFKLVLIIISSGKMGELVKLYVVDQSASTLMI